MIGVTVFDTDGANPYGREVASLLYKAGYHTDALLPEDVEWVPQGLAVGKIQPVNGPSGLCSQLRRQIRVLFVTAARTLVQRRALVVVMTRGWPDQLVLSILALFGARLVVVAHDPVPKTTLPVVHAAVRRWFWRSARVLIAHSEELRSQTEIVANRSVVVVPHLPFANYVIWAQGLVPDVPHDGVLRLLVLGQMRSDKGLDRLPDILTRLSSDERARLTMAFAGRGPIDEIVLRTECLVRVVRRPSKRRLSDMEIAQAVAEADVLVAPYSVASASGTVALALSRNIRVVAYDIGAIREVLASDGLVQAGDEQGFADALRHSRMFRGANPAVPLSVWQDRSLKAWKEAIEMARR